MNAAGTHWIEDPRPCVIVDLDGTICDHSNRVAFAARGDWDEYHNRLIFDAPHRDVIDLLNDLSERNFIIGCTGRSERYRALSYEWLTEHRVPIDVLLMRKDNDYRPDNELKVQLAIEFFEDKAHMLKMVRFVLDDRAKVVQAWRDAGLTCFQVRPGDF